MRKFGELTFRRRPEWPWWEVRLWRVPCSEYPMLWAHLWMDLKSGDCRFVVTSDLGIYWECPSTHPSQYETDARWEEYLVAKYVRKAVEIVSRRAEKANAEGVAWQNTFEAIWEYLSLEEDDDGVHRQTGMLCIFYEEGVVKIALQDRQEGRSLWAAAPSIPEALRALEARLRAGDGDWRASRGNGKKPNGKKDR